MTSDGKVDEGTGFAFRTWGKAVQQPLRASLSLLNTRIWNHD
jgi:hypothetical protein